MPTLVDVPQAPAASRTHRLARGYLAVALLLGGLFVATWALRTWQVARVEASVAERQREAVTAAFALIEAQFRTLQEEVLAEARTLATAPGVVQGLRRRAASVAVPDVDGGTERLVRHFASLPLADRTAAELYDLTPRLVAWKGLSFALDDAPEATQFLETYQTSIARDGDVRQALAVWHPVRDGARPIGAVRVLRLLSAQAPVQNLYLRDYRIAETWSGATGLDVRVAFPGGDSEAGGEARPEEALPGVSRALWGLDGTLLGRVIIEPPSAEALVADVGERFSHVLAFWATLALFWLVAGAWLWYRTSVRTSRGGVDERRPALQAAGRFVLWGVAWWGARYALLAMDVPARWQGGKAPLNPLFDPAQLASMAAGGLMRSMGDLLLTALFALVFAVALVRFAAWFRRSAARLYRFQRRAVGAATEAASPLGFVAVAALAALAFCGVTVLLAGTARYVVLDSTLDYFSRTGLWPENLPDRLRLIVFCALLMLTAAVLLVDVGVGWMAGWGLLRYRPAGWSPGAQAATVALAAVLPIGGLYAFSEVRGLVPWPVYAAFLAAALLVVMLSATWRGGVWTLLSLRGVLLALLGLTLLLYPLLYRGMDEQRRMRMRDAAEAFAEGSDPEVLFAIEDVLQEAGQAPGVAAVLALPDSVEGRQAHLDSAVTALLHGSHLGSLSAYDASVTLFNRAGLPVSRYYQSENILSRATLDTADARDLSVLRQIYREAPSADVKAVPLTGRRETSRFQYGGITPLYYRTGQFGFAGWAMARAEPRALVSDGGSAFPRILLPSGTYTDLYASLSLAEFRDGVLVRNLGSDFGRYRLAAGVQQALRAQPELWRRDEVKGRHYLTYYRRPPLRSLSVGTSTSFQLAPAHTSLVAVRVPALTAFDHLFYLLRLMIAGLFVALPLYALGLYGRWRAGLLPPPRTRFRDRVLNAFLSVGLISVVAVGIVGLRVVTSEDERDVRSGLRRHLDRAEEALVREARGEMPYRVLGRVDVDSLAAQVGLDLNVYRREHLVASSRPQLVRERLINGRLPIEAYQALYFDGYRFTVTEEQAGTFTYTVGFKALPDERGRPRYVISTATLPEQERIEEERARTMAYLFGALLLLLFVVMLTAALLAGALTRPIKRLREGLEAAAKGRYQSIDPAGTRDEIGDLVLSFNRMQQQLAESRRKLAQQERQLAWREMARQVAHEIKNPLTPMKLSVQHLRRAYKEQQRATSGDGVGPDEAKAQQFAGMFDRITATLIEQIDTLAHIANEFSSFARLPTRMLEPLDLNTVLREAVALMQEEETAEIVLRLYPGPLVLDADHEELRRIYINLIKNAIQSVPEGRMGRVEVTTAREPGAGGEPVWAYSQVKDNGAGIPAELNAKIFEPNFSTKTSGTGLGLAIVKKGIEDLSGEIDFETEEGTGTTFHIRLPLSEG